MAEYYWDSCEDFCYVCISLVLAALNLDQRFELEVDASTTRACAVWLQENVQSIYNPIGSFYRNFTKQQLNSFNTQKEIQACLKSI